MWAFGCILACLWTDSEAPYPLDLDGAIGRIIAGTLCPALPPGCAMHSFVRDCCHPEPASRIAAAALEPRLSKAARMHSLSHLSACVSGGGRFHATGLGL